MRSRTLAPPLAIEQALPYALPAALYLLLAAAFMPFVPDDTYITYQYARNLAAGHGLVFSAGMAPVEGYTNFLWILICAAGYRLFGDLVAFGAAAGTLAGAAALLVFLRILQNGGVSARGLLLGGLLLAAAGPFLLYAVSGMETPLFTLLLLLGVLFAQRLQARPESGALLPLALVGVLAHLTRPEGLLVFPLLLVATSAAMLLGVWRPARTGPLLRDALLALFVFLALLAAYHVWRIGYFGALLPTPFYSKGTGDASGMASVLLANLQTYFYRHIGVHMPFGFFYAGLAALAAFGCAEELRERRGAALALPIGALVVAFGLFYLLFLDWMPAMRYQAPLIPLLLLAAVPLLDRMLDQARRIDPRAAAARLAPFATVLLLGLLTAWTLPMAKIEGTRVSDGFDQSVGRIGRWLGRHFDASHILAVSDIGAVAWFSHLPVIDIMPRSLTDRYLATHPFSTGYVLGYEPAVFVLTTHALDRPRFYPEHMAFLEEPAFLDNYRLVGRARQQMPVERGYWVYVRNDIPLTAAQLAELPLPPVAECSAAARAAPRYC